MDANTHQISAHGLVLREWTRQDLAVMQELFDDPDVAYWTPLESPFDEAAALRYLDGADRTNGSNERLHLAVTRDGKAALGEVQLNRTTGSVGYIVGANHRGQGLAGRALRAITDYAHTTLELPRVILEIEADNHPSIAVAQSADFELTTTPSETVTDKGRTYDLLTWQHRQPSR